MTSPREQLALEIKAHLATVGLAAVDVKDWGHSPEELARPLVTVFRTDVEPKPQELAIEHAFTVQLMGTQQYATRETEAALEALLDEVLVALQKVSVVAWTKAQRKVFLDLFHGWEISVTWTSGDVYRNAI